MIMFYIIMAALFTIIIGLYYGYTESIRDDLDVFGALTYALLLAIVWPVTMFAIPIILGNWYANR